jgi:hypothetical protein
MQNNQRSMAGIQVADLGNDSEEREQQWYLKNSNPTRNAKRA